MSFCLVLFDIEFMRTLRVSQLIEQLLYNFSAVFFITIEPLQCYYITQSIQIILIYMMFHSAACTCGDS